VSKTFAEIGSVMWGRRSNDGELFRRLRNITDHYNGDVVIPLPDVVGSPSLPPLMPQLIHDGIEHTALRAAGPLPNLSVPAMDETKDTGKRSRAYAQTRRRAIAARWYQSQLGLLLNRAFRQLCGYGTNAFVVLPDFDDDGARIEIRDPLTAYPELRDPNVVSGVIDCGFVFGRSAEWVLKRFPQADAYIDRTRPPVTEDRSGLYDLVEWIDEDDIVVGLLGPRHYFHQRHVEMTEGFELRRWPNRAGRCTAVIPRRLTLERVAGQMDSIVGLVDWMSRLMALDVIAAEKGVFPDLAIIGDETREPGILGGQWSDGRTGDVNLLTGTRAVQTINASPQPMTGLIIDRLERAGRHTGGVAQQFGGELSGSIRSGRVIDQMGAFAIDPRVAELQMIMAASLQIANEVLVDVEKGYFGGKTFTVFSGWPGDRGHVTYSPNKHYESNKTVVTYNFPGSDLTQITVGIGQMVQADLMSRDSGRRLHPFVDDPDREAAAVTMERIDDAVLAAIQEGAQNMAIPLADLIAIRRRLNDGDDIVDAVDAAQRAAQERQATEAPPPEPGQVSAPEAQPGLSPPGVGVEQPAPASAPSGEAGLAALLGALGGPPGAGPGPPGGASAPALAGGRGAPPPGVI